MSLFLISLMFLLPFINMYHQLPILSFYSEWIAATLGLAAIAPILNTTSRPVIRIPQISLVFLTLAAILGVQWAIGMLHSAQYALLMLSYLNWAFLLTLLGSHLRRELGWNKLVSALAFSLVIAGIINGGIVVLQIVTRTGGAIPFLPYLPSYGPFAQENHFADFTALAIASLIYLYVKGRFSTAFSTLLLIWFLLMLAVSGSRSSWLYLIATVTLALVMQARSIQQNRNSAATRNLLYMCLATLPAFALIHLFTHYVAPDGLFNLTTDRIVNGINIDTPSARLQIWYDSLRLFWQSPWLGIGAGKMNAESFLLLNIPSAIAYKSIFEHAHNLFLHLLTEMGIGAFLITLTCLVIWIRKFKWHELNLETWWLITLLTILGIHSMLEYPLWYAYFLGVAAVLLGVGDEKIITINAPQISSTLIARLIRGSLVIVLLLGALNLGTMLIAHMKLANSIHQSVNADTNKQIEELDWVYRYTLLSPYAELMYAVSTVVDHNDIDRQIALNQSALDFRPFSKIAYQQVVLLKLKGEDLNAKKLLKRTLMVYPANLKGIVESMPPQYRKAFLQVLTELDPALSNQIAAN
ncbi:MAG TPA: Wzy polymerase domain-containing protein [Methylotenera sp.]